MSDIETTLKELRTHLSRRHLLQNGAAAGALGFFSKIPLLGVEDVKLNPDQVWFRPEIEPLIRLLEDTPRGRRRP